MKPPATVRRPSGADRSIRDGRSDRFARSREAATGRSQGRKPLEIGRHEIEPWKGDRITRTLRA